MKFNPFRNQKQIGKVLKDGILRAEKEIKGKKKGTEKRDMVVALLMDAVDIPLIPDVAEKVMWNALIGLAVELLQDHFPKIGKKADK